MALILMEPGEVRERFFSNFAGIRLDGSNATIIPPRRVILALDVEAVHTLDAFLVTSTQDP
ncbi:MAG: hypothetical protein JXM73_25725 [Anaerolineae bacterium]|nr:hypothetical protein [Anaerolineae bacterium]